MVFYLNKTINFESICSLLVRNLEFICKNWYLRMFLYRRQKQTDLWIPKQHTKFSSTTTSVELFSRSSLSLVRLFKYSILIGQLHAKPIQTTQLSQSGPYTHQVKSIKSTLITHIRPALCIKTQVYN